MKRPRILLWDIEASHLKANYGFIFCIGYKWLGEEKIKLISIRDFDRFKKDTTDDRDVVDLFSRVAAEADAMVTWYGTYFDVPFVQTRLLIHDLPPMPDVPHVDGWKIAKYRLNLTSNRLDTVSRVIPAKGSGRELKTPLEAESWVKGAAGQVKAIKYIEEHCRADIRVLEKVYLKLRPFAATVPNLSKVFDQKAEGCPVCGSFKVQHRGYRLTPRGKQRRLQCNTCRHWFQLGMRGIK